ncbi:MAG TPA: TonB-dependent receptor [Longimicrobiaceae bacterium]|nr:TonB-dependent receptor [Longimicrobiaceae bacterium]
MQLPHHPSYRLLPLALALSVLASAHSPAHAQTPARDTAKTVRLDTLSARVLLTPLPAARAPYGVSVVTEREIRRAKPGLALDEALAGVPGVEVDNRFNYALGERISIRGFGARAQFGVRGVRVLVDDVPATLPDGQTSLNHVDLGSIGRIEVIRGPASALYGNAAGGVIRMTMSPPPDAPFGSEYRATGGSDGLVRAQTIVGGQQGGIQYRASIGRLRYGGYREHAHADNTLFNARLGYSRGGTDAGLTIHAVRYDAQNPGSLSDSLLRVSRTRAFANNVTQNTGERGDQEEIGGHWERPAGPGTMTLSAYGITRGIVNPIPNAIIDLDRRAGGARAAYGVALSLPTGVARLNAGAEVNAQHDDRRNHANSKGTRGALTLDQLERVTGTAAFAQLAAPLLPGLDLAAAVRYDRFRFAAHDRLVTPANPDDSGARTMHAWSPTAGLMLRAAAGLSLYANVSTAFETPTTTELANRPTGAGGFNPDLQPERTTSYEAGAKGGVGRWMSFDLAAYRADVRDALIPFEVAGAPGRQFFRNAGSARHRGVEAGVTASPVPALRARLAYTYTDARFRDYTVGAADYSGNRIPGIAPHRFDGMLTLQNPRGAFIETEARYLASLPVDDANLHRSPAYATLDVRGGVDGLRVWRGRVSPFVGVTNLLGRDYNTSVTINAFGGRYYEPGPGRSLYAGATLAFGR